MIDYLINQAQIEFKVIVQLLLRLNLNNIITAIKKRLNDKISKNIMSSILVS